MNSSWTPKFKVGNYLEWSNEKFYIAGIKEDYYMITLMKNGPLSGYRFGLAVDNGYNDGYKNFDGAILLNQYQ